LFAPALALACDSLDTLVGNQGGFE
jgi:hypothetical protein